MYRLGAWLHVVWGPCSEVFDYCFWFGGRDGSLRCSGWPALRRFPPPSAAAWCRPAPPSPPLPPPPPRRAGPPCPGRIGVVSRWIRRSSEREVVWVILTALLGLGTRRGTGVSHRLRGAKLHSEEQHEKGRLVKSWVGAEWPSSTK
ncbi:atherin-like isoform X2 [Aythya fuligula]|uniref:Atherin-like isoform X2 n=1 Tax=Aythya fuligula TaxID=219594 RepID=A0A6J3D490_AYTFU|nr:atherin-like isoform X2 [Aythya fuligula]